MIITKNTIIGDILDTDGSVAPFFLEIGMHCLGCPSARGETIEEASMVHGTNADELVAKLIVQGNGLSLVTITSYLSMAPTILAVFCITGALIGVGGSTLAIRKFLQV